ncbi:MAG: hypothetical protein IKX59_04525 [Bacteroidales bacterium]|nr:hypothetical protein [Bacteroidales bacterium]MBR5715828.1 hypothetical protein [Bacteroidales bacterium]
MKIRLFLLFFSLCTTLSAQRALVPDTAGNFVGVPIKDVAAATPYQRQFSVSCKNQLDNNPLVLTPETALGYQVSRNWYISQTFQYAGETKQLFLCRVRTYKDSISFYVYFDDEAALHPIYYVQISGDRQLYPMKDDPASGYVSPLHTLLLSYPIAQDPDVRAYFDQLRPTPDDFEEAHRLALSKYPSHLPRFKWGIHLAMAFSKLTASHYVMDPVVSILPGVFADIPLFYHLSYHPELAFEKYAADGTVKYKMTQYNDVAYNVTTLSSPQLIRFTAANRPSRLLPYFETGAQFSLNLKHSFEYKYFFNDHVDLITHLPLSGEVQGEESIPATSWAVVASLGLEWQFSRYHSIWFSCRFVKELDDISRIGGMLQISYNL